MLSQLQGIHIPPEKELHFFDIPRNIDRNDHGIIWNRNFYFNLEKQSHWRWYRSRFVEEEGTINGDFTPEYCTLPIERIEEIKRFTPDAKVILLIRNPVDRAWSSARKILWRQLGIKPEGYPHIESLVFDPELLMRGEYKNMIERWESVFGESEIHYAFFDDIQSSPQVVASDVAHFLLGSHSLQFGHADQVINAVPPEVMPEHVRRRLIEHYSGDIEYLESRFDVNLEHWVSQRSVEIKSNSASRSVSS